LSHATRKGRFGINDFAECAGKCVSGSTRGEGGGRFLPRSYNEPRSHVHDENGGRIK